MPESPTPRPPARAPGRNFELTKGVRISADPETLSKDTLIDELYEVANYCNSLYTQNVALKSVLQNALTANTRKGN